MIRCHECEFCHDEGWDEDAQREDYYCRRLNLRDLAMADHQDCPHFLASRVPPIKPNDQPPQV